MRRQILIWLGRCRVPFSLASHRLVIGLWYTQPSDWSAGLVQAPVPDPGPVSPGQSEARIGWGRGADHYQTCTQFANTRQTGYLWHRNWYAIITRTLTSEHDWGLQWQWESGQAQQQLLAPRHTRQDRAWEMWDIKTNSSPSWQETLAQPSSAANSSAAPSHTQLYCLPG